MIFVFLIDTSVSMGQGLSSTVPSKSKDEQANESLFGDNGRVNRRWQRKAVQGGTRTHTSTRIECAKSIVEQIVTHRHSYEHDRYMLVTYSATGRGCIRSTLRDSRQSMLAELRRVEATDRFYGGVALTTLFDQLALTRAAYDMDTYGYGRYPTLNEQTRIVWLTDGASIVTSSGVQNKLNLPVNNTPWVESYVEPFRWDQRMVMVLLHEQGDKELCNGKKNSSESALLPMCMVMGGSVHHVGSMHQAQRFVEGFAPSRAMLGQGRPQGSAMANSGVLVNFERIDDNPANPGNSDLRVLLHATPCNVMNGPLPPLGADTGLGVNAGRPAGNSAGMSAMINGHVGYFPIPEAFWPETITPPQAQRTPGSSGWQIQRRSTHPTLGYSQTSTEWAVPAQFPFDKYQIDTNSSVAQKLLAAAQVQETQGRGAKPVCWPVFVNGSYTTPKNSGFPFGILRPNSARTAVNLFVLPYNFTALWKILGKLDAQVATQNTTRSAAAMQPSWRREFEEYLQHTPGYYAIPLKRAFNLYGIPHSVFPKTFGQSTGMRNITQYAVRTHSVARKEWDRVHASAEPATRADTAGLQQELLQVDPVSDVGRLVTNAFDVDRAHCLVTLSAMRRVFVRELMSGQSARFSANAIIPPLLSTSTNDADAMDIDGTRTPLSTPPLGSMEYSMFGYPQEKDLSHHALLGRQSPHIAGKSLVRDPDTTNLGPGMQYSPLGGLVDVASEDDRDSRHSVPIREMGEYGPAMHRVRAAEARDPLLDERTAQMQRKNMFGNPYRRPLREPRGPLNNVLARNPELSAKLGLSRSSTRPVVARLVESDDEAGLEMESEAEVNELAVDKNFEDLPQSESGSDKGGRFWWMQRRNVPRRRSIAVPWRKNDLSWNVNPWNVADTALQSDELAAITYTADSVIVNTQTAQIIRTASGTPVGSPRVGSVGGADSQDVEPLAAISHPRTLPGLGIAAAEARSQAPLLSSLPPTSLPPTSLPPTSLPTTSRPPTSLLVEQTRDIPHDTTPAITLSTSVGDTSPMDIDTPTTQPTTEPVIQSEPKPTIRKVNVAEERAWFLRRIKADPAHYDEESVIQRLNELQSNSMLGKPQLKVIVMAAMTAAKAMRRKQLIPQLEQCLQN